jgi:hypothetical protein
MKFHKVLLPFLKPLPVPFSLEGRHTGIILADYHKT